VFTWCLEPLSCATDDDELLLETTDLQGTLALDQQNDGL